MEQKNFLSGNFHRESVLVCVCVFVFVFVFVFVCVSVCKSEREVKNRLFSNKR